ncbi:MAG TPA: hypothetical protein VE591_00675 [Candidatus Acidoferrum sp.]|nr:hypothetical protein [Candidatus Acidoferrum sp.]
MKLSLSVLALAMAAAMPLAASAQANPPSNDGPPPEVRAKMQQARDGARTAAMNDLSPDHRAKVQAIVDKANDAQSMSDLVAAAKQIDTVLTPDEAKAVLGERDKMMQTMRANMPQGAGPGGPPPGGPGGPGGRGRGGMRNDAGRVLLQLSVSREKMRALREKQQQEQM